MAYRKYAYKRTDSFLASFHFGRCTFWKIGKYYITALSSKNDLYILYFIIIGKAKFTRRRKMKKYYFYCDLPFSVSLPIALVFNYYFVYAVGRLHWSWQKQNSSEKISCILPKICKTEDEKEYCFSGQNDITRVQYQ